MLKDPRGCDPSAVLGKRDETLRGAGDEEPRAAKLSKVDLTMTRTRRPRISVPRPDVSDDGREGSEPEETGRGHAPDSRADDALVETCENAQTAEAHSVDELAEAGSSGAPQVYQVPEAEFQAAPVLNDDDEVTAIVCDACQGEFELHPAEVHLVPEGEWYCPSCKAAPRSLSYCTGPARPKQDDSGQ